MKDKQLFVTPSRCIGCRSCELACSFSHAKQPGAPAISRVRTYMYTDEMSLVVLCQQCDDAACIKTCPTGALTLNLDMGVVEVDMEKCIRCRMCSVACPFGNITIEPETMKVLKCDLCGGDPVCAKFCPTKALEFALKPSPDPGPEARKRVIPPLPWEIEQKITAKK